jgi:hypothetical protein
MNVLVVVSSYLAIDPVHQRDPDKGTDTDAYADDNVSAFGALLGDCRRRHTATTTSQWVRRIDLLSQLTWDATLPIERTSRSLNIAREGIHLTAWNVSLPHGEILWSLTVYGGCRDTLENIGRDRIGCKSDRNVLERARRKEGCEKPDSQLMFKALAIMTGKVRKSCDVALVLLTTNCQGNVLALSTMSTKLKPLSALLGELTTPAV